MWHALPNDLGRYILQYVMQKRFAAAAKIQAAYRRYRITILIGRFRMLRYLSDFREWNPTIVVFLKRSTL
jgi:hypothetical protein